jgi:hypothetical protein
VAVRELASGVDALYLSGWADVPDSLLARLEFAKKRAQAGGTPVRFVFGGIDFGLSPGGLHKYAYRLSHEFGELAIIPSSALPPLRWQPRSEMLHGLGVESSVDAIRTLIEFETGPVRFGVSRLDLFADWQGWLPGWADERRFVRRAKHLAADVEKGRWTGYTFGRRSSGSIGGRIYDKTAEIAAGKGNPMWFEIWGKRYLPDTPVIRVEFEFNRKALAKQFQLDTPDEVLNNLGGLWAHATEKWLTHRDLGGDSTRSRLPISAPWQAIQHPTFRGSAVGLERTTRGKTEARLENILPVLRGCFTSASAQWGVDGMIEGLSRFGEYLHAWERATGHSIDGEIAAKRQKREWGL